MCWHYKALPTLFKQKKTRQMKSKNITYTTLFRSVYAVYVAKGHPADINVRLTLRPPSHGLTCSARVHAQTLSVMALRSASYLSSAASAGTSYQALPRRRSLSRVAHVLALQSIANAFQTKKNASNEIKKHYLHDALPICVRSICCEGPPSGY